MQIFKNFGRNFGNGGVIKKVIMAFLIILIILLIFIVTFRDKLSLKATPIIDYDNLEQYKTYIGNDLAIYTLLKKMPYGENKIIVKTDSTQFGTLRLDYAINGNEEKMKYNSLVIFTLVENVSNITYKMADDTFVVKKDDYSKIATLNAEGLKQYINKNNVFKYKNNPAYEMAINKNGMRVFKNPEVAYEQFKNDYADAISEIKKEFKLFPLSHLNYDKYKTYGSQVTTEDKDLLSSCVKVASFFDIYENSYNNERYNPF